jgi:hypothetical protein
VPVFLAFFFVALPLLDLRGSTAAQAWVQRFNGPANGEDAANALAVDRNGNVFVTGYSIGANGIIDILTVSYAANGTFRWAKRYDGPGGSYDEGNAIAVDANSGQVYVTGYSGSDFITFAYSNDGIPLWTNRYNRQFPTIAGAQAMALGSNGDVYVGGTMGGMNPNYAIVAYSSSGATLWAVASAHAGVLEAIAVGGNGNIYVTGWSGTATTGADYLTMAYSSTGIALWTNSYTSPGDGTDTALAIAADAHGNVYVCGYSDGVQSDYATVAYSSTGVPLWTNRYNGSGNNTDNANAVAVDRNGNVYVTGESYNNGGRFDFATIAYSNSGTPLWTNLCGTLNGDSSGHAVVIDTWGNVIVAGFTTGNFTGRDYATVAYTSAGTPLWTNRYNGPVGGADEVGGSFSLAAGPGGTVFVTGGSYGISGGITNSDFATIKYVSAPEFGSIRGLPNGAFQLNIVAPANVVFRLEASTNLSSWLTLSNFSNLPFSFIQYTDTQAPSFPCRYYRTILNP